MPRNSKKNRLTPGAIAMPLIVLLVAILCPESRGMCCTVSDSVKVFTDSVTKVQPRKPARKPARRSPEDIISNPRAVKPAEMADSLKEMLPDSIAALFTETGKGTVDAESFDMVGDSMDITAQDTIPLVLRPVKAPMDYDQWYRKELDYNPDPSRAVWMSALFPGLGQIYNRRFWKLPIIVGGYLGLGYATSWNNTMLSDYNRAYRDLLDADPSTKSYMDFFPSTTKEEDLDKNWLTNLLKSRKNYFRRNRDLCIIGMVGVYLLAIVDAYVDASLAHFDVTPDITMDVTPAVFRDTGNKLPSVGLLWAFTF